jgi:hypothetical protein
MSHKKPLVYPYIPNSVPETKYAQGSGPKSIEVLDIRSIR